MKNHSLFAKKCDHHEKINSINYFKIIFDKEKYSELFTNITSVDPLLFEDTKKYKDRINDAIKKTDVNEAISVAEGKINKKSSCCLYEL